ncbi:MAG: DUF2510 domain-containing protein [Solirubrobacteraceae bacterium]
MATPEYQAGWYAAPNLQPGTLRWWDGTQWTEHTHSAPDAQPHQQPQSPAGAHDSPSSTEHSATSGLSAGASPGLSPGTSVDDTTGLSAGASVDGSSGLSAGASVDGSTGLSAGASVDGLTGLSPGASVDTSPDPVAPAEASLPTQAAALQVAVPQYAVPHAAAQQFAMAVPASGFGSAVSLGAGQTASFYDRNRTSFTALWFVLAYIVLAVTTKVYLLGIVPTVTAWRALRRGEPFAPVALAVVFVLFVLPWILVVLILGKL